MTQLIAQQHVKKRNQGWRKTRPQEGASSAADSHSTSEDRAVPPGRSFRKPLLIVAGIVLLLSIVLFSSSALNHSLRGIGGGLGDLPLDPGLSSLIDSYLSPGRAPEDGTGDIVPTGKVLMSYDPQSYVVERGDTVSGIAVKFDLEMSTIISFNGIDNVWRLQTGVELKIPPIDGVMHVVRGNESLSSIADHYNVDLAPILDINNIDSEVIHEGDKLFVPSAAMSNVAYHKAMGDLFVYPLRGVLSSGFAMRTDPFTGVRSMHRGYDIVGKVGAPVRAANRGRVDYTGENNLYGKYVLIRHDGRYQTLYAHMSKIVVTKGQWVEQRQKVGEVGNTGRSTGPHLHFSIYYNGDAINPGKYLYY